MKNTWIVVPVTSNELDLTDFINKLSGGYTAPEKITISKINEETKQLEEVEIDHPYAGQNGPSFEGKIILVNMLEGYEIYDKSVGIESFGEPNIPRLMNAGIEYAKNNSADKIFVLSNPCDFDTFIVDEAIKKMKNTEIINLSDGVAFILDGETDIRLDENFKVWYWAEDLYKSAEGKTSYYRSNFMNLVELIPFNVDTEDRIEYTKEDELFYKNKWQASI